MTGPSDSVIGTKPEISINRALTQLPLKMEVAETESVLQGVFLEIDTTTGKAVSVERISFMENEL